ncbi:hypothetical protein BC940DRAFT_292275 [Gongronella butleri]|nr:hypothetical protein BC940DRAFT_292275 [Gongronella butleri]
MNEYAYRIFSTPSPLLVFPSASPSSKLRCTPTRKPPSPIDWTKECHQSMALEANHAHEQMFPRMSVVFDERDPMLTMASHLRRHSTPDFFAAFSTEEEEMINRLYGSDNDDDNDFAVHSRSSVREDDLLASMLRHSIALAPSSARNSMMLPPASPSPPILHRPSAPNGSNSSQMHSLVNASSSSSSYESSTLSTATDDDENDTFDVNAQYDMPPIVLERREQRRQALLQEHRTHYGASTTSSWLSNVPTESTTTRERNFHQRLITRKKSKFGLFIDRMKRAAERPFRIID